jgi:ferredoxin-nitrite reductase
MRGLVSCTGIDYCHFALIDTKGLAVKTAQRLEQALAGTGPLTMHWSGCPNACGNHTVADIGLLGKRTRVDGRIVDAVDISLGGRFADAIGPTESLENVPCDELPLVLQRLASVPIALTA